MSKLYCLKDKEGSLLYWTISTTESNAFDFDYIAQIEGEDWKTKYWKRINASMRSAFKLGWSIVEVTVKEVKTKGKSK